MSFEKNDDYYDRSRKPERLSPKDFNVEDRFLIGRIGDREFWTNMAVAHEERRLTNDRLMAMSDEELLRLAYADPRTKDGIRTEIYRRPRNAKVAEAQASAADAGKTYSAPSRALCILEFREQLDADAKKRYGSRIAEASSPQHALQVAQEAAADKTVRPGMASRFRAMAEGMGRKMDEAEALRSLSTAPTV